MTDAMNAAMADAHHVFNEDLHDALSRNQVPAVMIDPAQAFMPVPMAILREAAEMIARAPGLSPEFKEPDNCLAVAYQAARWRMDPIAVASKAYFTTSNKVTRIGYEAQLVHALVQANAPLRERLTIEYGYGGDGKKTAGNRFCRVTGHFVGQLKPSVVVSPTVAQIRVRNSPLWISDPDQQLAYYTVRAFARRHCPDVLLGVYAKDEIEQLRVIGDEERRPRALFEEDEPIEAEFEDAIPPTAADAKRHEAWENKQTGNGDSRDPRDAPANRAATPEGPPQGAVEPDDLPEAREWLANEQARLLGLGVASIVREDWNKVVADKRFGRLKAYDQGVTKAAQSSIIAHVKKLEGQG